METGNKKQHEPNKNNKKSKGQSPAQRQQQQIEEVKIEEDILQKSVESVNAVNNEEGVEEVNDNVKNGQEGIGQAMVENNAENEGHKPPSVQEPKKSRKSGIFDDKLDLNTKNPPYF